MTQWDDPTRGDDWNDGWGDARSGRTPQNGERLTPPGASTPHEQATPPDSGTDWSTNSPTDAPANDTTSQPPATPWASTGPEPGREYERGPADAREGFRRVGPNGVPELWPGPIPLRPLTFWEVLETSFGVLRFNPKTLFGLSFVAMAVATLVSALIAVPVLLTDSLAAISEGEDPGSWVINLANAVTGLATFVLSGLLIVPIADAALGRRLTMRQSWDGMKRRIPALIGYAVLQFLINALLMAPLIAGVVWAVVTEQWTVVLVVLGVGGLLTFAAVVYVNVSLSLAPVVIVLEHSGPIAAMRRSFHLLRGGWWKALGLIVAVWLLTTIASSILMFPALAVFALVILGSVGGLDAEAGAATVGPAMLLWFVVIAALSVVVATLIRPYQSAVTAMIYLDRRFRTEALAVDLLAEAERR
ncbi:hypothetical protein [Mobilicoccus massiliensis]|uniref:hypothetical protein n=1 Tax=Mobilicoccus massiliensis TaxID=1522310 RepID=UPI00058B15EF|nr:hypothetical protein [Mobilicoccus massiliensis]